MTLHIVSKICDFFYTPMISKSSSPFEETKTINKHKLTNAKGIITLVRGPCTYIHSRYFFGRTGRIRAVEVRPQKFRANFVRFGRISSIVQPKNLLIWGNFAQTERNSPKIFGAKLNCADSPISGEKNNYCVFRWQTCGGLWNWFSNYFWKIAFLFFSTKKIVFFLEKPTKSMLKTKIQLKL
jgi:hypothetical protein